ncbi:MAG: tetratricopeptide repeat protein [Candidatus Hydrogenedentes bacterium]|nr:tetratricopeptide repeat protein [Candidatus Hydrogenedentota bacterium]
MSIPFIRRSVVVTTCVVVFSAFVIPAYAQPAPDLLDEARQSLQKSAEEQNAYATAQMNGDMNAAKQHRDASVQLQQSARDLFDQAGAATSDDFDLLLEYARLLSAMEDFDLAEAAVTRAVALRPDDALAWTILGETQSALGGAKSKDALKSLQKAISLGPEPETAARSLASLGALYQEMGLYDFARESLTKALEVKKDHRGAIIALASLDLRNGDVAKASDALDALGTIPELQPFLQHTIEGGLADFEASRRWMPDLPENHLAYAKLLTRVGRVAEAMWPLRRCVKLQPDNYVAWNLLGSVYRGMNRIAEAQEAFGKSLSVNPDQPRTKQVLDELAKEQQQPAATPPQDGSTAVSGTEPPQPPPPASTP